MSGEERSEKGFGHESEGNALPFFFSLGALCVSVCSVFGSFHIVYFSISNCTTRCTLSGMSPNTLLLRDASL